MRDKELQKLVDKAAKSRDEQAERAARQPPPKREPPPPNPVRIGVYARMHDGGMGHILWWIPFAVVVGVAPFLWDRAWMRYAVFGYLGLLAVRLIIYAIGLLRGFAAFKRFPADLTVKLEGWYPMLDEKIINDAEEWQASATLEIELAEGTDKAPYEAVLDLFIPQASRAFYPADGVFGAASDPRKEWTREGTLVTGSLNVWVLGALYRLINQIDWVQRKAGGVSRIVLSKKGSVYRCTRPSAD